jgi:hypothetical protein
MEKTITYKIDKNRKAEIEITLTDDGRFSVSGTLYEYDRNKCRWECDMCGQCLDSLSELIADPVFMQIYWLWKRYHLNDLHAGTPVQEYALEHSPNGSLREADYTHRCEYLKSIGLYEVGGYKYGHGWLSESIEPHDLELIKSIVERNLA